MVVILECCLGLSAREAGIILMMRKNPIREQLAANRAITIKMLHSIERKECARQTGRRLNVSTV